MAAAEEVAQSWERLATQVTAPRVTMHNGAAAELCPAYTVHPPFPRSTGASPLNLPSPPSRQSAAGLLSRPHTSNPPSPLPPSPLPPSPLPPSPLPPSLLQPSPLPPSPLWPSPPSAGVQLHLSQRSKTGYRGVKIELGGKSKKRRRPCFVAQLQSKQGGRGRNVMLGRYETPVEAAVAYARAVERRRVASLTPFK